MSYSTLSEFKAYLWIDSSDTSQDAVLTQVLNSANSKLNHICWVDDFTSWKRTQIIEERWIFETARWLEFYLKNKPVASIDKLNWSSDVWTKWTDYLIIYDRRAIFKKLQLNDWWMLEVEYTSWFQTSWNDVVMLRITRQIEIWLLNLNIIIQTLRWTNHVLKQVVKLNNVFWWHIFQFHNTSW